MERIYGVFQLKGGENLGLKWNYISYFSAALSFLGEVSRMMADKAVTVQELIQVCRTTVGSMGLRGAVVVKPGRAKSIADGLRYLADHIEEIFADGEGTIDEVLDIGDEVFADIGIIDAEVLRVD